MRKRDLILMSVLPSIPHFPPELLLLTLSTFLTPSPSYSNPRKELVQTLASCARVSKSWYPIATQILWTFPRLQNLDLNKFKESVWDGVTGNGRMNAENVKTIDIIPPKQSLPTLIQSLVFLPNLKELFISRPLSEQYLDDSSTAFLLSSTFPKIESFRINAPASLVLSFIKHWPSLRFLDVSTRTPAPAIIPLRSTFKTAVQSLRTTMGCRFTSSEGPHRCRVGPLQLSPITQYSLPSQAAHGDSLCSTRSYTAITPTRLLSTKLYSTPTTRQETRRAHHPVFP